MHASVSELHSPPALRDPVWSAGGDGDVGRIRGESGLWDGVRCSGWVALIFDVKGTQSEIAHLQLHIDRKTFEVERRRRSEEFCKTNASGHGGRHTLSVGPHLAPGSPGWALGLDWSPVVLRKSYADCGRPRT